MAATSISETRTSSGSYTVPSGNWYVVSCYISGGGGGGGGGDGGYGGGGGGQSAFVLKNGCAILLTGGNTISYTIGAGGAGGSVGATGSNGGASSVTFGSTTFTTGLGQGGEPGTGSGGGLGGASTDTGAAGNDAGFSDVGGDGGGGATGGSGSAGTAGIAPGGGGGGGADGFAGGAGAGGRLEFKLLAADVLGTRLNPFIAAAGTTLNIQTSTLVEGDVGSISGNTISTPISGTTHLNDTAIQNANTDATAVYNFLRQLPAIADYTGFALGTVSPDLTSLPPGVYSWSGAAQVINNFTLNGTGIYVFQVTDGGGIPGTFRVENGSRILLGTGARPENVYFVTQSGIDVRSSSSALGNFITAGNITANPIGSLFMYGRLLAPSGSIAIGRLEGRLPTAFCYAKDTGILTERGYVPICDIQLTDRVVTKGEFDSDGKVVFKEDTLKKVTFVGKFTISHVTPNTAPIRFTKGSLGENTPFQDLIVSPNHSIIYNGNRVSAGWFVNDKTVFRMTDLSSMEYYVIELEDHSVIDANGVLSESMLGDSSAFIPVATTEKIEMHLPLTA